MKNGLKKGDIAKARKEAKEWMKGDRGRKAILMLDISDGDVWVDVFTNENDSKVYKSETIVGIPVNSIITDNTTDHPLTAAEIDEAVYQWCIGRMAARTKDMRDVYDLVLLFDFMDDYYEELMKKIGKNRNDSLTDEEYEIIARIIKWDSEHLYQ